MRLNIILGISIAIWLILAAYVFAEVKKTYERDGLFSNRLLTLWFVMWGFFLLAVLLAALDSIWPLPIDSLAALILGIMLIIAGLALLAAGMLEFRSWRRSCGQDASELVTTGVYRWSRNPQFLGCLLSLLGIALAGRSGLAFALAGVASAIIIWYTLRLAEPYLERLYGEAYRRYKSSTPRWIGRPGPKLE